MINVAINCLKRLLINFAINFVLNYMINYQLFSPGPACSFSRELIWRLIRFSSMLEKNLLTQGF